jgi:hypothetical protein
MSVQSPADVRRSVIARLRADHRGIGRTAPDAPLDIVALCKGGALTSKARDGSTFSQGVRLQIEPLTYPPKFTVDE